MQFHIAEAQTTYNYAVSDAEPVQKRFSEVMINPVDVTVIIDSNGEVVSVSVSGQRLREDGTPGRAWSDTTFHPNSAVPSHPPAHIMEIVRHAQAREAGH